VFEVLSKAVSGVLAKVLSVLVDIGSKELSWRRSAAGAFFDLFDALTVLVVASTDALKSFEKYAEHGSATKLGIRGRLTSLLDALQEFSSALRRVESKLAIYDRDLLLLLEEVSHIKSRNLVTLDLLTEAAPTAVEGTHKVTYVIEIPGNTALRDTEARGIYSSALSNVGEHRGGDVALMRLEDGLNAEKLRKLKKVFRAKFKTREADLSIPAEARIALETARADVQRLEDARRQLGDFIREAFPLNSILK